MAFIEPAENIKNLNLREGSKVADFGAGSGFYTLEAAKRVRALGKVFAIDVQKDVLSRIQTTARASGLHNIEVIWGDMDKVGGTKIRDLMIDAVIISNSLFQSENKQNVAKEAFRIMKNGGEVMIIDWADSFGNMGPLQDHVITEEEAKRIFEESGFKHDKSFYAGDHHWGMVLKKV